MTLQQELEALIAEIDATLEETAPRLPWVMASSAQQQRQLLTKARACLVQLQAAPNPSFSGTTSAGPGGATLPYDPTASAASQVLNALLQEMQYLRGQTLQILTPLQNEVAMLRQQRETLLREVQQLQQQRLAIEPSAGGPLLSPGHWEDTLRQLTSHLDAHLTSQIEQAIRQIESSAANTYLLAQAPADPAEVPLGLGELSPSQRLDYLRQIQSQTDDLIRSLDVSLRAVFDTCSKM
ncbi:MAG: hypothetical protein HC929_13795 [Leptolyngbyaceae cyanobacterium SM2_5_2]|nr:hypothetical protein [Leptolyngbyaceae cyanobacterium SM2_5_2]